MYEILKESTGQKLPQPHRINSLPAGFYYAIRGFLHELFFGVTGIIVRPIRGCYKKNSFGGFVKGLGLGVAGCLLSPITGLTRSVSLISLGLAVQAIAFSNMGKSDLEKADSKLIRARPKRRIETKG